MNMFSHFLRKLRVLGSAKAADARTLRHTGRKWHLAPNAMAAFGPNGPDLDHWLADGFAEIVKTGPHRTVYRVALLGGTVYLKHCRISGSRAWAREAIRPPKARLEFENLIALQQRDIAAVVPLAWGSNDSLWPSESYLITRSLDDAVPFLELAGRVASGGRRGLVAQSLGRFFAKLHDAGVAHPDPHPGNLLVQATASGPRFALIDLHAVRIAQPLTWPESRPNLVLFNRWFQLRASRTDRLRFWHAYRRSRTTLSVPDDKQLVEHAREVERGTMASNLHFWAGRASRCLANNRYFRKVKTGSIRGHAVSDLPEDVLAGLLANPDALFSRPGSRILKDSRTSKVAAITIAFPEGPREVILKRVNVRHWTEPFKNLLRPSAVLRSWINGHTLRDRWLPTPRPLAMLHRYRFGMPDIGYLLTEKVNEAEELIAKPQAADRLARIIREMHDRAVSHRDLKASNVLLERGTEPVLIDLVGVRVGKAVSIRQRCKELARLNASFLASPFVSHTVRLRFLRTYLNAGEWITDWKSWWRAISLATTAKQAKNRRSGRPLM